MQQKRMGTAKYQPAGTLKVLKPLALEGLTTRDIEVAAAYPKKLAKLIAVDNRISVKEAKRDVRDLLRVTRAPEGKPMFGSKRMRRARERATFEVADRLVSGIKDLVRHIDTVVAAGGLAGKPGTKIPPPPRKLGGKSGTKIPRPPKAPRDQMNP